MRNDTMPHDSDALDLDLESLLRSADRSCPQPAELFEWIADGSDPRGPVSAHLAHCRRCQTEAWLLRGESAAAATSPAVARVADAARRAMEAETSQASDRVPAPPALAFPDEPRRGGADAHDRPFDRGDEPVPAEPRSSRPGWALAAAVLLAVAVLPFFLLRPAAEAPALPAPETADTVRGTALVPAVLQRDDLGVPTLLVWSTDQSSAPVASTAIELRRLDGAPAGSYEVDPPGAAEPIRWTVPPEIRRILTDAPLRARVHATAADGSPSAGSWVDLARLR